VNWQDRLVGASVAEGPEACEGSPTRLPEALADIEQRRKRIRAALEQAKAADEARRKQGINPAKNPDQVPMTDSDSKVMPNKEGGYAPNFTPTAVTDGEQGFLVDADVLGGCMRAKPHWPRLIELKRPLGESRRNS
jgi:hypothetical protein